MQVKTDAEGVKRYDKARRTIPPPVRPLTAGDAMFEELAEAVEKPPVKERPDNLWVRPSTWLLVDRRAAMRKEGALTQL